MKKFFLKGDIIVIVIVFTVSLIFSKINFEEASVAVVRIDGVEKGRFSLSGRDDGVYVFKSKYGSNTVEIKEGNVRITETDCPDELCRKQGKIKKSGKIICLPNHLTIEITGDEKRLDGVTR